MQNNAFAKQLATILGIFGISANFAGTRLSLISGLAHVSGTENYVINTLVCFFCTLSFSLIFYIFCIRKKDYFLFNAIAVNYCGFVTFTAMYIVTGNLICGFPFYMLIIPIYYGFSIPLVKKKNILPALNLILYDALFILTFKAPYFPCRQIIPNLNWRSFNG